MAIAGANRAAAEDAARTVYLKGADLILESWRLLAGAEAFENRVPQDWRRDAVPNSGPGTMQGAATGYTTIPGSELLPLEERSTEAYWRPVIFDSRLEGDAPDKALQELVADVRSESGADRGRDGGARVEQAGWPLVRAGPVPLGLAQHPRAQRRGRHGRAPAHRRARPVRACRYAGRPAEEAPTCGPAA